MPGLASDRVDYVVAMLARGPDQKPRLVACDDNGNLGSSGSSGVSTPTNIATGHVTVNAGVVLVVAARVGRQALVIQNLSALDIWLGGPGVGASSGMLLLGTRGQPANLHYAGDLYAYCAGAGSVAVSELY